MSGRRFEVQALLGEGAFGAVYLARSVGAGIHRPVAIKVLHEEQAATPATVKRLRDEARMLAMIRHRAIVRVDDLVQLDGRWSIVMEYVEGCDVARLLDQGPLPARVALTIAEEVANALHTAWSQAGPDGRPLALIHRDVKPSNIRLTAQGEVKLLDFGVARAEFAEREAGTTRSGFGTLTYMAPERFEGRDTHSVDVYALGVTVFEMLTGVPPGKLATDANRQPPGTRLAQHWAALGAISPDLHALVAAMLRTEPTQRPTALECARTLADLRAVLREERLEDWAAREVPIRAAASAGKPHSRTGTLLIETERPPKERRSPLPWLLGGGALVAGSIGLVALGVAAWIFFLRTPQEVPARVGGTPLADAAATMAEPVPAPAEVPAPEPEPVVASAPETPTRRPKVVTGRVEAGGDAATIRLAGPAGEVGVPGNAAPGTYTATVRFEGGTTITVRDVGVTAGETTRITCNAAFARCTVGP